MAAGDSSDKTEKPTPKRLQRGAREGSDREDARPLDVGRDARDDDAAADDVPARGAGACPTSCTRWASSSRIPTKARRAEFAADAMWKTVGVVAPMLIGMMLVGLARRTSRRSGFKPTSKKLKPDFSRLNPSRASRSMVGTQAWWELGKALAKTALLDRGRVARDHARDAHADERYRRASAFGIAAFTATTALDDPAQRRRSPVSSSRPPTTRTRSAAS